MAHVRTLDLSTGAWTEKAAVALEVAFKNIYGTPVAEENLHGIQMCFDSDRQVFVGLTSTDLDGRRVQYDPVTDLCFFLAQQSQSVPPMYAFRFVP